MLHASPGLEALVRQAFGLLIEARHQGGVAQKAHAIPVQAFLATI
jgi:hypothetical protein